MPLSSDVQVVVNSQFIAQHSDPERNHYVFAYTIQIKNLGQIPIQLLERYWLITSGSGNQTEVQGEGVVGEQPLIMPDSSYQYTSGVVLESPIGSMKGYYTMVTNDGTSFKAPIECFHLRALQHLH